MIYTSMFFQPSNLWFIPLAHVIMQGKVWQWGGLCPKALNTATEVKGEPERSLIKLNVLMFKCWHTQPYLGPREFKKKKKFPLGRIDLIYMVLLSLNSVKPAKLANEGKLWSILAQFTFSFHNNLASDRLTQNLK